MAVSQTYVTNAVLQWSLIGTGSWRNLEVVEAEWTEVMNEAGHWWAIIPTNSFDSTTGVMGAYGYVRLWDWSAGTSSDPADMLFEGMVESSEIVWMGDGRPGVKLLGAMLLGELADSEIDGMIALRQWETAQKVSLVNWEHERSLALPEFTDGDPATWANVVLESAAEPEAEVGGVTQFGRLQVAHPKPFDQVRVGVDEADPPPPPGEVKVIDEDFNVGLADGVAVSSYTDPSLWSGVALTPYGTGTGNYHPWLQGGLTFDAVYYAASLRLNHNYNSVNPSWVQASFNFATPHNVRVRIFTVYNGVDSTNRPTGLIAIDSAAGSFVNPGGRPPLGWMEYTAVANGATTVKIQNITGGHHVLVNSTRWVITHVEIYTEPVYAPPPAYTETAGVLPYHPGRVAENITELTYEGKVAWLLQQGDPPSRLLYYIYLPIDTALEITVHHYSPPSQRVELKIYEGEAQREDVLYYNSGSLFPSAGVWRNDVVNLPAVPAGLYGVEITNVSLGGTPGVYVHSITFNVIPVDISLVTHPRRVYAELYDGIGWQSQPLTRDRTQAAPYAPWTRPGEMIWPEFPLFMPLGDPLTNASGYLARFWARNPTEAYDPELGASEPLGGGLSSRSMNQAEVLVAERHPQEFLYFFETVIDGKYSFTLAPTSALGSAEGTLWRYYGETPLAIMQELAERTGYNFRLLPGRQIEWFEGNPNLGVTAFIAQANPDTPLSDNAFYVTSARQMKGSTKQFARVKVYGAGTDDGAKIDISRYVPGDVTLPDGINVVGGLIYNDDVSGDRLRVLDFPQVSGNETTRILSAELVRLGVRFLLTHERGGTHWEVEGVNLSRNAYPGGRLNFDFPQLGGNGTLVPSADYASAVILSIRHRLARGLRTYSLSLSSTGSLPPNTSLLLAEAYLKAKRALRYPQPASLGQTVNRGTSAGSVWNPSGVDEEGNVIIPSGGGAQAYCEDEDGVRRPCLEEVGSSPVYFPALQAGFETMIFGQDPPHYWREGNTVFFGGAVRYNNGSGANSGKGDYDTTGPAMGTVIFSVPPGYQAMTGFSHYFILGRSGNAVLPVAGATNVEVSGDDLKFLFSTTQGIGYGVSLDGISYRTNDAPPTSG